VAARRFKRGLTLPWERRADALRAAFQNARWKLVVLVVAVLAVGWVIYRAADQHVKIRETRAAIADVHRAIEEFRRDTGRCPDEASELTRPPRSGRRYLREIPPDGWGNELFVQCPARFDPGGADVVSAGPSGDFFDDDNVR
jgi:type II secretory pathway pseudopilin PulG